MAEPSAIWSMHLVVFDQSLSLTQNVIMSHARLAVQALIERIDRLHALVASFPRLTNMYPHRDIPATLSDLCFQQGIASTILFNDGARGSKESSSAYKLRLSRIAYVQAKCASISTAVLSDRKVRNSLTHIEEYLAKAMKKERTGWFIDAAIWRRDEFSAKEHGIDVAFCRTYIASEDTIIHLGHEISLNALREEADGVLAAIWQEPPCEPPALPGQPLQNH
jgi:hypothetical protein